MNKALTAAVAAIAAVAALVVVPNTIGADSPPAHAQLSSSFDQTGGGTVEIDQIDSISGMSFNPDTDTVTAEQAGLYLVVAAPQVGSIQNPGAEGSANFWLAVNGTDVDNSNVTWQNKGRGGDVIVSQGVVFLQAGDEVSVEWSTTNPALEAITTEGEPLTPSIIFTAVRIG